MEQIRISDGTKSYQLVNQDGNEIGVFRFNPSDLGIVERYNEVVESLSEIFKELGQASKEEDGAEPALKKASAELKAKMDILFGCDTSPLWAVCSPLTPLEDGQLYIESVLAGISVVVEAETRQRLKKVQRHIDKYTKDYEK